MEKRTQKLDFPTKNRRKKRIFQVKIDKILDYIWSISYNPLFSAINLHYFCCIFTSFARIKKINTDVKSPFNGEYGSLTQLGVRSLYRCLFLYYRSKVDSQEMALDSISSSSISARDTHAFFVGVAMMQGQPGRYPFLILGEVRECA